tara:strand:- start:122 stop:517 length:396 start_codon:yes stop_codon:yes gene_type:complete
MSVIEEEMERWHYDNGIEMTASDAAFYKKFAEDFEYSNRRIHPSNLRKELSEEEKKKNVQEYLKQLKEERKHDEYLHSNYVKEWKFADWMHYMWDGKPRKSRRGMVKNPDYVGPRPIQELLEENQNDDPWN